MPEQYDNAAKLDKAEEVNLVPLPANDQTPEVVQPGKETLDLPTSLVTTQRPPVLGPLLDAIAPVRSNQSDAVLVLQSRVQGVTVIGPVTDQALGLLLNEALAQCLFN